MQREPKAIRHRADANGLGTLQAVYRLRKQSFLDRVMGPFAVLIGCTLLGYFYSPYNSVFGWWPSWAIPLITLLAASWMLVGLWITLNAFIIRNTRIFVYTHGLIWQRTKALVVPWRELEGLWKDVTSDRKKGIKRLYLLQYSKGTLLSFKDDIVDIAKLGDTLEEAIVGRFLNRAIATYNAGASSIFDQIVVNSLGIALKQERSTLTWKEFARISIDDTTISIYKIDEYWAWATIHVENIPNVALLKALVEYILQSLPHKRLATMLAMYTTGLPIDFGSVRVSQQGIFVLYNQMRLSWSEIASIGIGPDEVIIGRHSRDHHLLDWYVIPLARVSDASLLRDLVTHLLRGNA